jgi:hypothetical protein
MPQMCYVVGVGGKYAKTKQGKSAMNANATTKQAAITKLKEAGDGGTVKCSKEIVKCNQKTVINKTCTTIKDVENFFLPRGEKSKPRLSSLRTKYFRRARQEKEVVS